MLTNTDTPMRTNARWRSLRTAVAGTSITKLIPKILRRAGIVTGQQWCRVVMDAETRKLVDGLNKKALDVLEISGTKWSDGDQFKTYRSVGFPEWDVCGGPLSKEYDLIIAEQVWEHLLRPLRATQNVYAMLKDGGSFLVTTPFLIRIHEEPNDCSRWTETGLRGLLMEAGFPSNGILTGSWGNRKCLKANLSEWVPYHRFFHSLRKEPDVPLVVWAIARKALTA